jgi:hypothetical protein
MSSDTPKRLILDTFAYRSFDKTYRKNYIDYPKENFLAEINKLLISYTQFKDGYAPFCKHLFIKNFVPNFKPNYVPITEQTEKLIKTCYETRQQNELPVLSRYIPLDSLTKVDIPDAKYLDIILYSKEQIIKEKIAMKESQEEITALSNIDFEYGIIAIKPQDVDYELPMLPITMMRNALGVDQGGSGVQLEREKYMESVAFWEKNVIIQ